MTDSLVLVIIGGCSGCLVSMMVIMMVWGVGGMVKAVRDRYRVPRSVMAAERPHRFPTLDVMAHWVPHLAVHKTVQHCYRQTLKFERYRQRKGHHHDNSDRHARTRKTDKLHHTTKQQENSNNTHTTCQTQLLVNDSKLYRNRVTFV